MAHEHRMCSLYVGDLAAAELLPSWTSIKLNPRQKERKENSL